MEEAQRATYTDKLHLHSRSLYKMSKRQRGGKGVADGAGSIEKEKRVTYHGGLCLPKRMKKPVFILNW